MILHTQLAQQVEEYRATLHLVVELRRVESPGAGGHAVDREIQRLLAIPRQDLLRLSLTELLARLMRAGTAHEARLQSLYLVALLREAGELEEARQQPEAAAASRLRALDLLLDCLLRPEIIEAPDFVPTVEGLVHALGDVAPPPETLGRLMLHYEQSGQFGRAEDILHDLLSLDPGARELRQHGEGFYRRLLALNDETLLRGNFSRNEAEEGLTRLRSGSLA